MPPSWLIVIFLLALVPGAGRAALRLIMLILAGTMVYAAMH